MPELIALLLRLDETLGMAIAAYGAWVYAALFAVVFSETGLVVTPFLPGDSLLFAAGAFAGAGALNVWILWILLFAAAVLGDSLNYRIGLKVGTRVLEKGSLLGLSIKKEHLEKTQRYYDRYGAKTIVLARFMPIVRTFAPFVAGVGRMRASVFFLYNVLGAALWVTLFVFGGYFFGNIPAVKKNFEIVILAIVFVSVLPAAIAFARERRAGKDAVRP